MVAVVDKKESISRSMSALWHSARSAMPTAVVMDSFNDVTRGNGSFGWFPGWSPVTASCSVGGTAADSCRVRSRMSE